jgi:hypothetical protein
MLKNSLYFFSKKIRINFSDIFEEWNDWVKKSYRKPLRIFEMGLNEDNKVERKVVFGMVLSKLADMLSDFVGYLCSKYNKQHEFKSLLKYVQKDARRFLESCGINRERM